MVKRKSTNNNLPNITHKTKDRVTRTPLKTGAEIRCFARVSSSCSTSGTHRNDLKMNIIFYFIYSLKNKNKCRNFQIFNLNIKNITLTFSEEVLCLFDLVFYLQNRISTVQRIKKKRRKGYVTPLSTIFQLHRDSLFYWGRKRKKTDLS